MRRTLILCALAAAGGYLLVVTTPAFRHRHPAADLRASASSSVPPPRDDLSPRSNSPTRILSSDTPSGPVARPVTLESQCEGNLAKIPEHAFARLPFKDRAELDAFAKRHPQFVAAVRDFARTSLREDLYAATNCFRMGRPTGPVPATVEWNLKASSAGFSLSSGKLLKVSGDPAMLELARKCLEPVLSKTFTAPAPPLGGDVPSYDGPMPWAVSLKM